MTYFPIHAYGWRDATDHLRWVRYRLVPVDAEAGRPAGEHEGRDRLVVDDDPGDRPSKDHRTSALRAAVAAPRPRAAGSTQYDTSVRPSADAAG